MCQALEMKQISVVGACANILLVSEKLYPYRTPVCGNGNDKKKYSKITGIHIMQWGPETLALHTTSFNDMVDTVRKHMATGSGEGSS